MRFRWYHLLIVILACLLVVSACKKAEKKDEEATPSPTPAPTPVPEATPAPEGAAGAPQQPQKTTEIRLPKAAVVPGSNLPDVPHYSTNNRKDPFRMYLPPTKIMMGEITNPLLKYEIRYFTLVGIIKDTENPLAIFEDPEHKCYTVHIGDGIGKNGGIIREIMEDAVVVVETRVPWIGSTAAEIKEIKIQLRPEESS